MQLGGDPCIIYCNLLIDMISSDTAIIINHDVGKLCLVIRNMILRLV